MSTGKVKTSASNKKLAAEDAYKIGGRIWIEKNGQLYLGWGRVMLLQRIAEMGSIAAAARSMKLAYRNAWLWVDAMNRLAPSPLVEKAAGGEKGGRAVVTEEGHKAIKQYTELRAGFRNFMRENS
jgi:molybdate transport system regulatory protein